MTDIATPSPPAGTTDRGRYIGRSLPRLEDLRLVRGAGRYTDDVALPGQAYAAFVRSPHAHASILHIDTTEARAMPGVLAVLTGADYAADGCAGVAHMPSPADAIEYARPAFVATPEHALLSEPHWPLAIERVRHVGEAVVLVVAESAAAAREAVEAVVVDYAPLPAVTDVLEALREGAPVLWPAAPDNIAVASDYGDGEAVAAAFAQADLVVEQVFRNQRIANAQMEPRSAIGDYDAASGTVSLISGCQGVHRLRLALCGALKLPAERVRVVCPDVGGGFGLRSNPYPEQIAVAWAARRLGRSVKWTSDRSEAFLTDYQGRDLVTKARLALTRDGRIRALALELIGNVGAQTVSFVPLSNGIRIAPTVYDVPVASVHIRGVVTNTVSTAPFRGAGRPEATLVIERLLDIAAARLKLDRVEIRRRNLIRREALPYLSVTGLTYDSGDFAANMAQALALADWGGFPARRAEAARRGRHRGIGVANYVESPVGAPHERVELRVAADGSVALITGTQSTGQGHETSFAQVTADLLGVRPEDIRFIAGDTATVASGGGTHSDRSMRLAGTLMVEAAGGVIAQAKGIAALLLAARAEEIDFADGLFVAPRTNRRLTLFDIAQAIDHDPSIPAELRKPLAAEAKFTGRIPAHPTGAAVCELEVDPDTGAVEICRYTSVDDAGQPINPMILHGQVHGGIAQGVGQALVEAVAHAPESGEVLTGSFMDYGIPRAALLPDFTVALTEDATHGNPLRIKGGGESGITPALAAVMNALVDALSSYGIEHLDMPATAQRIWTAIGKARNA